MFNNMYYYILNKNNIYLFKCVCDINNQTDIYKNNQCTAKINNIQFLVENNRKDTNSYKNYKNSKV